VFVKKGGWRGVDYVFFLLAQTRDCYQVSIAKLALACKGKSPISIGRGKQGYLVPLIKLAQIAEGKATIPDYSPSNFILDRIYAQTTHPNEEPIRHQVPEEDDSAEIPKMLPPAIDGHPMRFSGLPIPAKASGVAVTAADIAIESAMHWMQNEGKLGRNFPVGYADQLTRWIYECYKTGVCKAQPKPIELQKADDEIDRTPRRSFEDRVRGDLEEGRNVSR